MTFDARVIIIFTEHTLKCFYTHRQARNAATPAFASGGTYGGKNHRSISPPTLILKLATSSHVHEDEPIISQFVGYFENP